jgi:hypothetical protein
MNLRKEGFTNKSNSNIVDLKNKDFKLGTKFCFKA